VVKTALKPLLWENEKRETSKIRQARFSFFYPMPDLITSLRNHDLGHLQIVAELWGLELHSNELNSAAEELSASLLDPGLVHDYIDSLNPEARAALLALVTRQGRIPWAEFTRLYGEAREMGPGRRDREKPYLHPASAAEALFYRALLARTFFDTPKGPQEFAYIPDDLFAIIHHGEKQKGISVSSVNSVVDLKPLGRLATPAERAEESPADDRILDDATTLLAALRLGITAPDTKIPMQVTMDLLRAAGLINENMPQVEPVKAFLEAPRREALKILINAWRASGTFNELRLVPGLTFDGEWTNPAAATRMAMLGFLAAIPKDKWWSLPALIQDIKNTHPDFQRQAGDYDSWFIRRASDNGYLRGFTHWDEVDGALIRFFIAVILHSLGMVDIATAKPGGEVTAFRLSNPDLRKSKAEDSKMHISSQGLLTVPRLTPRAVRYQVARFCEWDTQKEDEYRYHVTPLSLQRAKEQGLKVEHLLPLLAKNSAGIPPALVKALKRWEVNGTEARVQNQLVLRVTKPEVLEQMRKSKAARFLGESLSPTAVIVKDGAQSKVLAALAELGLLAEDESTKNTKDHEGE
jgi:hypothetical protein